MSTDVAYEIRPAPTTGEKLIVINYACPSARELIDLSLSVGARKVPAGGFAIMPRGLGQWSNLRAAGFLAIRQQGGGWHYILPHDKRRKTMREALREARQLEEATTWQA